jgi:outer membrane receptor for Fe3+-dicitrate
MTCLSCQVRRAKIFAITNYYLKRKSLKDIAESLTVPNKVYYYVKDKSLYLSLSENDVEVWRIESERSNNS